VLQKLYYAKAATSVKEHFGSTCLVDFLLFGSGSICQNEPNTKLVDAKPPAMEQVGMGPKKAASVILHRPYSDMINGNCKV
jgi:hypothetical protein